VDQAGSTSGLVVVLVGVLATFAVLVGALGGALADLRRVEAAADLAALAGAGAAQSGEKPCPAATSTARRNRADLVVCTVIGDVVTVVVQRRTQVVLGRSVIVTGRARAGPVG
jgi:secretion/DNA translocation related TadE-like protein